MTAALEKWRGATAQAWEYSISHSQLLIRLHRPGEGVNSLFLHFKGCERVSFDREWKAVSIQITEKEGRYGTEFVAADADQLFVRALAILATELPYYGLKLSHQFTE